MTGQIATIFIVYFAILANAANIKRITNGENAQINEIPFIVALRDNSGSQSCGGSLVDSFTVLTAAHCVSSASSVTAGIIDLNEGGVNAEIASVKSHPLYNETNLLHDIAILKLSTPIQPSDNISYAELPVAGSNTVPSSALAAGWGSQIPVMTNTDHPSYVPPPVVYQLSKIILPIRARNICLDADPTLTKDHLFICAGGDGKTACHGDSGGPLFNPETRQLIGVFSGMVPDHPDGKDPNNLVCNIAPVVFTQVSSYMDFITPNLGGTL